MNKYFSFRVIALCALVMVQAHLLTVHAQAAEKIRILLVTGGHDYDTNQFNALFNANAEIAVQTATHPTAQALLRPDSAKNFDVLVLYDLWGNITEESKQDFLNFLKAGKGLVVLHHAIANYQSWPEYEKIIGGKYYLQKTVVNGVEKPGSTYKHDVDFKASVADAKHPITKGVSDFTIHDETYGLYEVSPDVHVLLTTQEPTNSPKLAWVKNYGAARVVYLQLGHDHLAYANTNYQRLVAQSIRWAAKR